MTHIIEAMARGRRALLLSACALPAAAMAAPEAFWGLVGKLAAAAPQGGQAVVRQWPGRPFPLVRGADANSAALALAPDLQTSIAEMRLAEGDAVQLMVLKVQGGCITPDELIGRYARVENADFPQPDNPDPVRYRVVHLDGVRVSFGFLGGAPGCLAHVVFNPRGR